MNTQWRENIFLRCLQICFSFLTAFENIHMNTHWNGNIMPSNSLFVESFVIFIPFQPRNSSSNEDFIASYHFCAKASLPITLGTAAISCNNLLEWKCNIKILHLSRLLCNIQNFPANKFFFKWFKVFANRLRDQVSVLGWVIPKTYKWYLMLLCLTLSIIR